MEKNKSCGSVGGKIKRWDFRVFEKNPDNLEGGKTNFIDSIGLRVYKSHRFENIGEGEVDYGQYDKPREIFGVSGSVVIYRREALEDVAFVNENTGEKEYFDASMFMYKEDIDLAYRLQWAGWKSFYIPTAVAYHDRTVAYSGNTLLDVIKNRENKNKKISRMSYLNHQLLLKKNFSDEFSSQIRGATFWYNMKVFLYLMIFETELLTEWFKVYRLRKNSLAKRKSMPRRVSSREIERLMEQ